MTSLRFAATAVALAATHVLASAAAVSAEDWTKLSASASKSGYVPVVVDLADVSLVELKYQSDKMGQRVGQMFSSLKGELGDDVWGESASSSAAGQATMYVTPRGLELLRNSSNVLSLRPGAEWNTQSVLFRGRDSLDKINQAIARDGTAKVVVMLNIEGLEFQQDSTGAVTYTASDAALADYPAVVGELTQVLERIPGSKAAGALTAATGQKLASARSSLDPTVTLDVTKRELVAIARSNAIRDIWLESDKPSDEPLYVAAEALSRAEKHGEAEVMIRVRSPLLEGHLSARSSDAHWKSIEASMDDIKKAAGGAPGLRNYAALGVMLGRVSKAELAALNRSGDPRLEAIAANVEVARPAVETSNPLLGMPLVWNTIGSNGYISGAGATVVVMDTGVQSAHNFLRGTNGGGTRVTRQACFGSTIPGTSVSLCPAPQDIQYNSFGATAGEAFLSCPYSNADMCHHGTSVAGVAAGGSVNYIGNSFFYTKKSVAYAANIWSYNVYSKRLSDNAAVFNVNDILEALYDVLANTTAGTYSNKVIVNISGSSGTAYPNLCLNAVDVPDANLRAAYSAVQQAVNSLYARGIAVVAATGNSGAGGAVGFPACLAKVVKVGAMPNGGSAPLDLTSNLTNLPDPADYPGDQIWMVPGGGSPSIAYPTTTVHMPKATVGGLDWHSLAGTSFAAPHVSGILALLKSTSPTLDVPQMGAYLDNASRSFAVQGVKAGGFYYPSLGQKLYKGIKINSL